MGWIREKERMRNTHEKAKDILVGAGVPSQGVVPIPREEFNEGFLHLEYLSSKNGDLIFQFFWREPVPFPETVPSTYGGTNGFPAPEVYKPFPSNFRAVLYEVLMENFSEVGIIDWVPEVGSWYVEIKGGARVSLPRKPFIAEILHCILTRV